MKIFFILCVVSMMSCISTNAYALKVSSFDLHDFDDVKYEDRVCIATDLDSFDFLATDSRDVNQDGMISFIEQQTHFTTSDNAVLYIGNTSSRYNLSNAYVWVGTTGMFDSFKMNTLSISYQDMVAIDSTSVILPYEDLRMCIDDVVLIDIESEIAVRASKYDPIATCNPFEINISDIVSQDPDFQIFITSYGAIKSGINSKSPMNSDTLITMANMVVTPEPGTMILFGCGIIPFFVRGLKLRK